MDLLLSAVSPIILQRRPVAAHGMTVTADGYMPGGGGRHATRSKDNGLADRGGSSSDGSLGLVLAEAAIRLALFAGCVYTSVRFTQYLSEAKKRENQVRPTLQTQTRTFVLLNVLTTCSAAGQPFPRLYDVLDIYIYHSEYLLYGHIIACGMV